ncbi:MAG: PD40 domain-containing protein [Anaerolineae bacterium]|nr:PD40 domain-containing protein [Anaerolineae bacterium]
MKHILWIMIPLVFILFGCAAHSRKQTFEPQTTVSSTIAPMIPELMSSLVITATYPAISITSTTTPTSSLLTPTATASETLTSNRTPIISEGGALIQRCSNSEPTHVEQSTMLEGLVLIKRGETGREIAVLGGIGLQAPIWVYQYPDDNSFSIISPNGDWIAFISYTNIDRENNLYSVAIRVTNWNEGQEFQAIFDNLTLSRFRGIEWLNNSQIILPLSNEAELFYWLIWSPLTGNEERVFVNISNISKQQRFLDYAYPGPDPLLELVVYPCEDCGEAEYAVRRLQTEEIAWFIDLDTNPSYVYRSPAYWSPDGRFVTVIGGQFLNQLLFFNREGEKIYEIPLPLLDDPGGLIISARNWSPNSNYLAFLRVTGSASNYEDTLTYIDIQSKQVVDLCINARTGFPIWSPDSTKIAFSQQIQSGEQSRLISIVDIHSGDVVQLDDVNAHNLIGWIDLADD